MNPNRWSFNTGNLAGSLPEKVAAMTEAGFAAATLWHSDLFPVFDDPDGAMLLVKNAGLTVTGLQFVRDIEGTPPEVRARKLELARLLMGQLRLIGGDTLVLCSTTSPTTRDWGAAVAAMRQLGDLGKSEGVRIAYEPMCYSEWMSDYRLAWKLLKDVDHSHVGLVLDTAHIFLPNLPLDGIAEIPGDKIFLVELNDFADMNVPMREKLKHYRLFPGEGTRPVRDFVDRVLATGYRGDFALEVFNAAYRGMDPKLVAKRGFASLEALFGSRS